ncbi:MAG: hypothetical protein H7647_11555, partial [Candidatus Heimdallarchaeota archaeon]|nr:hypothetical protein [Candidatus Heimdallarchaeota archaeon]
AGPLVGLDPYYSIPILFVLIAIVIVVVNFFLLSGDTKTKEEHEAANSK